MRMLLVEDDERLAEFICKGMREAGFEVDHAASGPAGLEFALHAFYDVCVFDLMLPGMDGKALIEQLRRRRNTTPILVLSAKQTVESRVEALEKGGDDFLTKPFAFTELLARVHALVRRASGYGETTRLTVGGLEVDLISREVFRDGNRIDLQNREFELLAYLMRNTGRVVSKTMIIQNVWNFNFDPHTNIVEARMSKLRDKVDKGYGQRLIHTLRGVGYVLREDDA